MPQDEKFLQEEEAVNQLLQELTKIKTANEQINNAKTSSENILKMAENIIAQTSSLIEKAKQIFSKIDEKKLQEQIDEIQNQNKKTFYILMGIGIVTLISLILNLIR